MGSGEGLGSAEPSQRRNPNKHPSSTKVMSAGLCRAQRPVISNGGPCNRQRKKREGRTTSKELKRGKSSIWRKLGSAEPRVPRNDSWGCIPPIWGVDQPLNASQSFPVFGRGHIR